VADETAGLEAINRPVSFKSISIVHSVPLVLTSTLHRSHASRSGYPLLAEYLPRDAWITAIRSDPDRFFSKMCARLVRRFAFSRWYLGGSAVAEWNCRRHLRHCPNSIVHMFWADADLGFLDYFLALRGDWLCGTFHHCSDTIASVIRFPHRLRRFAAVILMSETQRAFMLDAGVSPERIHVVLHGVDTQHFTPPAEPVLDPWTVLSVGGYRRNFVALRAVCHALHDHPKIRFRIIGPRASAPIFAELTNVAYESGLSDDELLNAYRGASCFLTLVENATANNALLEAMACGLPVLTERIGGIPEYVNDRCARLVAPDDVSSIAESIVELHDSNETRLALGKAARVRAEELDWARVAENTCRGYESIIQRTGGPVP
jgi:glycosyltransferase involved in cell wall biosynthesis